MRRFEYSGEHFKTYLAQEGLQIGSMRRDQEITLLVQLQQNAIPLGLKLKLK